MKEFFFLVFTCFWLQNPLAQLQCSTLSKLSNFLPGVSFSYESRVDDYKHQKHLFWVSLNWNFDGSWRKRQDFFDLQYWRLAKRKKVDNLQTELEMLSQKLSESLTVKQQISLIAKLESSRAQLLSSRHDFFTDSKNL